jgi:hypothetical protein
MKLIDKAAVVAEIKERIDRDNEKAASYPDNSETDYLYRVKEAVYKDLLFFLNILEVKEVDLEKLGEIARHLIAVKEHTEDMRLDKEEWFMLEKIGYPERFKAQKGE